MRKAVPGHWIVGLTILCLVGATAMGCRPKIEKIWEFPVSSPIYSTPLIMDNLIVFGSESGTLHAVDKNGRARWSFQTPSAQIFAHPQTDQKFIFFGATNQKFYAVDQRGEVRWQFAASERIKSDPAVLDNMVFATSYDGHIYALDTTTGKKIWQFPNETRPEEESQPEATPDQPSNLQPQPKAFSYAAPKIQDGVLYVGNLDGYFYAIQINDGSMKWRFKAEEGITSTAWIEGDTVYFGSKDDHVYALDTETGQKIKWKFKTADDVLSSPVIADNILYIGSNDKNFYALDAKTGEKKCQFTAQGPIISYGAVYNNLIVFGAGQGDGHVYVLNRSNCQLFHRVKTGYKIESDPVLDNNIIFVTSGDRKLYAFRINKTE